MNRRGNGLSAESYDALGVVAAHLTDAMLRALREAGVAAYVVSSDTSEFATEPASGPDGLELGDELDRLFVDAEMRATAEGVLHTHLTRQPDGGGQVMDPSPPDDETAAPEAGPAERDEESIWAEIVAGYDSTPDGDDAPWPDQENLHEPSDDEPPEGKDRTGTLPLARVIKPADPDEMPPVDDEGHYVPPPPPPLPETDPVTKGAWLALVGGPLYLLLVVIIGWEVPGWAAFLAVAAFIGGFVTLVLRMGDDPRDPDDGAVV